jgi:hypothetical protein
MPIERGSWRNIATWPALNLQLARLTDVFTGSDRVATQRLDATAALALTWPQTLIESDTTGGAVTLTLPDPATVPGFRVEVVKLGGAPALTANGVTVTAFAGFVSTGANWRRVG